MRLKIRMILNFYKSITLYTGQSLIVSISVSPPGLMHQASSSLNLTCGISGQSDSQLSYQWTSTCTGNCFVLGRRVPSLMQTSLHSIDSGNHTCSVIDGFGNQGMATIQITVVGELHERDMSYHHLIEHCEIYRSWNQLS